MKKLSLLLAAVVLVAAVGIGVLSGQKSTLTTAKNNLEKQVAELTEQNAAFAKMEEELKKAQDELTAKTAELTDAQTALKAAQEELDKLKADKEKGEGELSEAFEGLKAKAADLEKQLLDKKQDYERALADKVKELEAALSDKEAISKELDKAKDALLAAIPELSKDAAKDAQNVVLHASKEGFGGPVAVAVSFNEAGEIVSLEIGDKDFCETDGFGAAALEPEFAKQFIGKKAPLKIEDIDAISGATITSEAVVEAINDAANQAAINAINNAAETLKK